MQTSGAFQIICCLKHHVRNSVLAIFKTQATVFCCMNDFMTLFSLPKQTAFALVADETQSERSLSGYHIQTFAILNPH